MSFNAHLTFAKLFAIFAAMNGKSIGKPAKRIKREAFKLSHFTNPSGQIVWRVSGTKKDGNRFRHNFKTEEEAQTAKGNLEREDLNMAPVPMMATNLTAAQLQVAGEAFRRIGDRNLLDIVDYYLENYRPAVLESTLKEAAARFMADKGKENKRERTIGNLKSRLDSFVGFFPEAKRVSEVLPGQIKDFLYRDSARSPLTVRNDFLVVRPFFKWCVLEKYCAESPATHVGKIKFDAPEPTVLPAAQIRSLMAAAAAYREGMCVPFFALATFCGIRPKELERITWENIDLDQKVVMITKKIAKTRSTRSVELSENALAWLRPFAADRQPIKITRRAFEAVRRHAQLADWQSDVLRHTAISNHLAAHKDAAATALWAGNSVEIIHRHYKYLLTEAQAVEFWAIMPEGGKAKEVARPAQPATTPAAVMTMAA